MDPSRSGLSLSRAVSRVPIRVPRRILLEGARALPSCGAKRAALFSQLLQSKILADIPQARWVVTVPKLLRPYFLYHRELLGELARLAYETVREMMLAAVDEPHAASVRPRANES
jgi:hypothetical protein